MNIRMPLTLAALAALAALAILGTSTAIAEPTLDERCHAEVVELHQFLEDWFNAELPATDEALARFADVIDPSFLIIGPDGVATERGPIVEAIRAGHGRWREAPGTIRIESFHLRQAGDGLALATYEEWHDLDRTRGRISSVLFGESESAPNGLAWLHLHEVWIGTE